MAEVSKRITLIYNTSVYVEVEAEGPIPDWEVWKVVVADEGVEYDEAQTIAYNTLAVAEMTPAEIEEVKAKVKVVQAFADEAEWPTWSFG
jgi:hypothetical protein